MKGAEICHQKYYYIVCIFRWSAAVSNIINYWLTYNKDWGLKFFLSIFYKLVNITFLDFIWYAPYHLRLFCMFFISQNIESNSLYTYFLVILLSFRTRIMHGNKHQTVLFQYKDYRVFLWLKIGHDLGKKFKYNFFNSL